VATLLDTSLGYPVIPVTLSLQDHHCVIAAAFRPPADWKRPVGRLRTTWLRTIDDDLQSLNFRVHTAWRKARDGDI